MFLNGKRSGIGIMKYENQVIYQGEWEDDKFHGKGILFSFKDESISKFSGCFHQGNIEGFGTLQYLNGQKIRGKWMNEEIIGNAVIEDENGVYYGCAVPESRIKSEVNHQLINI